VSTVEQNRSAYMCIYERLPSAAAAASADPSSNVDLLATAVAAVASGLTPPAGVAAVLDEVTAAAAAAPAPVPAVPVVVEDRASSPAGAGTGAGAEGKLGEPADSYVFPRSCVLG